MREHTKFRTLAELAARKVAALSQTRDQVHDVCRRYDLPPAFSDHVRELDRRLEEQMNRLVIFQVKVEASVAARCSDIELIRNRWREISAERETLAADLTAEESSLERLVLQC